MAADSVVRLIVDATKAVNPLRAVNKATKKAEDSINKLRGAVGRSGEKFRQLEKKAGAALISIARNAKKAAGKIKKAADSLSFFSKAALAAAAAAVTFKTAQAGINRAESVRRIKLLGQSYGEVAQLEALAAQNAQKFNLSQTEANQAIADVFARLRPLGVSLDDINSTFAGFRTAAVLGGATAQEASAAFTQLSQALGSGALRGDEFRSVSEQAPLVLQAIADETGLAAGQLKEYAAEGLLTSDIVIKALKRIETEGADKLKEALGGPAAAIKEFQNATEDLAVAASETIIPGLADAFRDLAQIIRNLEGPIKFIGGLLGGLLNQIRQVTERISGGFEGAGLEKQAIDRATKRVGRKTLFNQDKFNRVVAEEKLMLSAERMRQAGGIVPGALPASAAMLPGVTQPKGTSPLGPLKGDKTKEVDQEKERLRILKERQKIMFDLNEQELKAREAFESDLDKLGQENRLLQAKLDGNEDEVRLQERINELAEKHEGFDISSLENLVKKGDELRKEIKLSEELEQQQQRAAERLAQTYRTIGDAIKTGVVDTLTAAVEGTKSLAEVASNTLKSLANTLLKLGMNAAFGALGQQGGIFGQLFGGERANGGTVTGGRSYLVGERGPELFTPGRTGSIAPNSAMSGSASIVVNVDATGSAVQGDAGEAKQLGDAIGVAIRQELLKQKRPGGLLA